MVKIVRLKRGWISQRTEDRNQKSEDGEQESEAGGQFALPE